MSKLFTTKTLACYSLIISSTLLADTTVTTTGGSITEQQASSLPKGLASARPEVKNGVDLFITGDLLIWQTQVQGLAYAIENKGPTVLFNAEEDLNVGFLSKGHIKNPHFSYQYGFNVGLGCNLSHDGWDARLNWTWLRDHSKNSVSAYSGSTTIYPTFMSGIAALLLGTTQGSFFTAIQAASTYHLHLDLLDLEMGREFFAGKWLAIRPFFGLRSAWIKQKYNISYQDMIMSNSISPITGYNNSMTNNFWGFGPRLGLNGEWQFGSGWSLYGNAAFSLLYGYFHLEQNENILGSASNQNFTLSGVGNSFHSIKAATDLEIGLRWDYMFFHDTFHLGLHAGWQQELFFSQNQFMSFPNFLEFAQFYQNQGDLGFQGWTIGARFDF